jgi:hypothetical protein
MDQLQKCVEVLRRLAKEPDDPDCVVLAEQAINDYLRNEIEALRAALEQIGKAIDEEAAKGRGEDWSLMVGYVQAWKRPRPRCANENTFWHDFVHMLRTTKKLF